jgi:DNA-binding transcriptional LysR family regulator
VIEVRQACYFLAVAQTLHFRGGRLAASISQPPLSQAVPQLERQLGVALLDRRARTIVLTTGLVCIGHVLGTNLA